MRIFFLFLFFVIGCTPETKPPIRYQVRPTLEENTVLFCLDFRSDLSSGGDLVAFHRDLNEFMKVHPELVIKSWQVIDIENIGLGGSRSVNVAKNIIVFVEKKP